VPISEGVVSDELSVALRVFICVSLFVISSTCDESCDEA